MAIGTGTAILAGTLGSAIIGSAASRRATRAQVRGADAATQAQLEMYYQSREDLAPWREAGEWALNWLRDRMTQGPGEYTESPGYQFRLGEGVKALERGAAARGGLLGGAQQKALTRFGQDYATQDYDNFLRRYYQSLTPYQSMAGIGQTSAGQTAQLGYGTGQGIAQNYLRAAQAQAGGAINVGNILSGGVTSGLENYLLWNYLQGGGSGPPNYSHYSDYLP